MQSGGKTVPFDVKDIKSKLSHMHVESGEESDGDNASTIDYTKDLPLPLRQRVGALEFLQKKHAELQSQFREERVALEKKYLGLYAPIYLERAKIVNGDRDPTAEELASIVETGVVELDESGEEKAIKGIPGFWLTVLNTHPAFAEIITEKDEPVLSLLQDIRISFLDNSLGFRLEFHFAPNDCFTQSVLTKTYFLENSSSTRDDFLYDHAEGCKIDWKEGKNLCFHSIVKMQRHRQSGSMRSVRREEKTESFFHFFNPPAVPKSEEDLQDVDADELDEQLQSDYELGDLLKSKLIPYAVDWFSGRALEYEDIMNDDDFDVEDEDDEDGCCDGGEPGHHHHHHHKHGGDDSDEEEEDDDEEEEEEEEEVHSSGKNNASKAAGKSAQGRGKAGTEEAPQCKQQ